MLGVSPEDRVERGRNRIEELLGRPGKHVVTAKASPVGQVVTIDGSMAFVLVPGDTDALQGEDFEAAVATSVQAVQTIVDETRESRDLRSLGKGLLLALIATLILVFLVWGMRRVRRAAIQRLGSLAATMPPG